MIKKQAYIRSFSQEQKAQLEKIAEEESLKNATDVFLHCLNEYHSVKQQNDRLNRFLQSKNKKIKELKTEIEILKRNYDNNLESIER